MLKILSMALILLNVSGCSQKVDVIPKVWTIDAHIKELPSKEITYTVYPKDVNITTTEDCVVLPYRDAVWIDAKLNRCIANSKKLTIALDAANSQIEVLQHAHNSR